MSMSTEDAAAFRRIIAADPECKQCFECGSANPQWCDINHAVFICLECSGVHRSLGVHLSFVRSSTMDSWASWRPEKLRQMERGGNRRARLYFESHNVPRTPIKARYECEGALKYAAMLEAETLGTPFNEATWQPPEWYTRMKSQQQQQSPSGAAGYPFAGSNHASPVNNGDASRFTGMGSSPAPSAQGNTQGTGGGWFTAMSSGWSSMTQKASQLAQSAQENMANTDVDGMTTSLSRGWTSVTSAVSNYAKQVGLEDGAEQGGLEALREHARSERAKQPQQEPVPGRFDHIEHIANPAPVRGNAAGNVASGWGSPTTTNPRPAQASPNNNGNAPSWGTTTAFRVASPTSPGGTANRQSSSGGPILSGKPVEAPARAPQKKDDDWGWDDDEE